MSAAWRRPTTPPSSATTTIQTHLCPRISSPPQLPLLNNINLPGQPLPLVVADQVELFYSDRRKCSRSCLVSASSSSKRSITAFASEPSPLWARIASRRSFVRPSWRIPLRDPIREFGAHAMEEEIRMQWYSCQVWRVTQCTFHLAKGVESACNRLGSPWFT